MHNRSQKQQLLVYISATLYPFIVSPHILAYDLVILIPVFVLWFAHHTYLKKMESSASNHNLIIAAICVYAGVYLLLIAAQLCNLALLVIIPVALLLLIIREIKSCEKRVKSTITITPKNAS